MKEKRTIILCRGIQGSGKSSFAKQWVLEDPELRVRYNNDDVRNMLGKYWVPSREGLITSFKDNFAREAISSGYNIVVDNMNLNPKEYKYWQDAVSTSDKYEYTLEFKDFFIPVEECIIRDSHRENPIGEKVIRDTWKRYRSFITNEKIHEIVSKHRERNDSDRTGIIVDLDATLCYNVSGRPFYGKAAAEGIPEDVPVRELIRLVNDVYNTIEVNIVTGRENTPEIRTATIKWLNNAGVKFDNIYFRAIGDYRPSSQVKEDIYHEHLEKINIDYVIEDDNKCVAMWRGLGLICLQPNDGNL